MNKKKDEKEKKWTLSKRRRNKRKKWEGRKSKRKKQLEKVSEVSEVYSI